MKTTEIFVELVVVGFGPLILTLLYLNHIELISVSSFNEIPPSVLIIFGLVYCYIMGIIVDRISDTLFSLPEDKIRKHSLHHNVYFQDMRSYVFKKSEHIKEWVEYGRLRLRVARGWAVNSTLMIIFYTKYYYFNVEVGNNSTYSQSMIAIASIILLGCLFSWYKIARGEYKRIQQEYVRLNASDNS